MRGGGGKVPASIEKKLDKNHSRGLRIGFRIQGKIDDDLFSPLDPTDLPFNMRYFTRISPNSLKVRLRWFGGSFGKTVISLSFINRFKRAIHQMKGYISLYYAV